MLTEFVGVLDNPPCLATNLNSTLVIGCHRSAATRQKNMADAADGEDEFEAVDQRLSESQTFSLYKDLRDTVVFGTPYTPRHPPLQALLSTDETRPSPLSGKSIAACTLSDFVFDAFPRLRRAKGPNRERQALSSDRERVEQPPSLFTHDRPIIRAGFRKFATICFVAKQVVHAGGNTRNRGFQLAMQQCCNTS